MKKFPGQFKSGFKRTINWNKYQFKRKNPYLDYLSGVKRLCGLMRLEMDTEYIFFRLQKHEITMI